MRWNAEQLLRSTPLLLRSTPRLIISNHNKLFKSLILNNKPVKNKKVAARSLLSAPP